MNRKEDVEKVKQVLLLSDMQKRAEESRIRSLPDILGTEMLEAEKKLRLEAEKKLRATGVVNLFEELRDSGVVKYLDKPVTERLEIKEKNFLRRNKWMNVVISEYEPACIIIEGSKIDMEFNWNEDSKFVEYNRIIAYMKKDELIVRGREEYVVSPKLPLAEAVGKAIIDPEVMKR